jgi:hypothetical protein
MAASFLETLELLADPAATKQKYQALQDAVDDANRKLAHSAAEQLKFDDELRAHRAALDAMTAQQQDKLARETAERKQELDDREKVLNARELKLSQGEAGLREARAKHEAEAADRMAQLNAAQADRQNRAALRR